MSRRWCGARASDWARAGSTRRYSTRRASRSRLGWARMATADGSAIMFLRGEEEHPVKPELQGVMLVLYTSELPAVREQLVAAAEKPTEIERPPWMPSGHIMLRDPDGYTVGVNQ